VNVQKVRDMRGPTHVLDMYYQKLCLLKKKFCRACPGVEPGTSRTLSENHATRPTGLARFVSNKFCYENELANFRHLSRIAGTRVV